MSNVVKYHVLGNDYLVADPRHGAPPPDAEGTRLLCDRHTGVGADGVLYGPLPSSASHADFDLRIFNSDGTECARSGNGLRIFARYLREHGYTDRDHITLRTPGGSVGVRYSAGPDGPSTIDLGTWTHHDPDQPGSAELIDVPLEVDGASLRVTAVHNGVPHIVVPVDDATKGLAFELGPSLAGHPAFPARTNVEFLTVQDRNTIRIEIWERGAGYTLASGSGACAAACAAYRLRLTDQVVTVVMPGGSVTVEVTDGERVLLTGESSRVGSTALADEFLESLAMEQARCAG